MGLLPEDMLTDILRHLAPRWLASSRRVCQARRRRRWISILRHLAPRWLASSRRVCRAWRAAVDGHGLQTTVAALLPRSLAGIFIQHDNCWSAFLLRRPSASASAAAAVSADLDYTFPSATDDEIYSHEAFVARDHCNGLLLVDDRVVNPATRQWARLPPRPPPSIVGPTGHYYFYSDVYLAYDPAVSPHYEVFAVPRVRRKQGLYNGDQMMSEKESPFLYNELDPAVEELKWPPSPCVLHVFSSRTGRWEKRSFVRRGAAAAGTVADMRIDQFIWHRHAVYWGGLPN
nr:unnamed protein product [Digitaria exilis]